MRTQHAVRALATLLLAPLVVALALVASSVTAVVDAGHPHDDGVAVAVPTVHVTLHVQPAAVLPDEPDTAPPAARPGDEAVAPPTAPDVPAAAARGRAPPPATA